MNVRDPNVWILDILTLVRLCSNRMSEIRTILFGFCSFSSSTGPKPNVQFLDALASQDCFIYIKIYLHIKQSRQAWKFQTKQTKCLKSEHLITKLNLVRFAKPNIPFSDVHCTYIVIVEFFNLNLKPDFNYSKSLKSDRGLLFGSKLVQTDQIVWNPNKNCSNVRF